LSEPAPAAVFVHGAGGGGWEWRVWARIFAAAGRPVSAPDLRPSDRGLAATGFADYAAQVRDWVAAAGGGRRVVLVGASLGGLLAAAAGGSADALVLVNPLPPAGLPGGENTGPVREWGRRASLAGTRAALPDADAFATYDAWTRWRDESGRALAEARAGVPVPAPAVPCLVIASDDDRDVPAAATAGLAAAWRADLLRVPGSHVGPLLGRHAAATAAQALAWLNGRGR
jgi:pimeloyl-ACP methyl ester carboxylesterase